MPDRSRNFSVVSLRRSIVSLRRFFSAYDDLPPGTTDRRMATTVFLRLRRAASAYDGLSRDTTGRRMATTVCLRVRRSPSGYDDLPPAATDPLPVRRSVVRLRRSALACDGPPPRTTVYLPVRRIASGYDGPSYAETDRFRDTMAGVAQNRRTPGSGCYAPPSFRPALNPMVFF